MSLRNILQQLDSNLGIGSPDLNAAQRVYLVNKVNEAAEELYNEQDLQLALEECYVRVTNSQRVSLPPFVGQVRGMRSTRWDNLWRFSDIRRRYNSQDWPQKWNNGRVIGVEPIAIEWTNTAPGTLTISEADSTLIVTLSGSTAASNNEIESVTMSSTSVNWTKNFTSIRSIQKNQINTKDVIISDADGQEAAILYADQLETYYLILDISQYPNLQDCSDGSVAMELLYKPRLPYLYFDYDTFPIPRFDSLVVLRAKQLIAEDKPGQEQRAILAAAKSSAKTAAFINNVEGPLNKKLQFERNGMYSKFRKFRSWRWCGWRGIGG